MSDFKMTKWQRGVLVSMYTVACRSLHPMHVWFPRRALEHLMWFDWHGSHTAKIDELIRLGWLVKGHAGNGLICYRLTDAAHGQISVDIGNAIASCHYDPPTEDMFADLTYHG